MMAYDDHEDDDELEDEASLEPDAATLAHWLEDQYTGDERFESLELNEPGPLEGEAVRLVFYHDQESFFFVSVFDEDGFVRVGLATGNEEISNQIEESCEEQGDSLTDFLADAIGAHDELEHEVQHFHDDVFYFCTEIPYQSLEELVSGNMRDEVIYYLDGYVNGFSDFLE